MNSHLGTRRWAVVAFALLAAVAVGTIAYQAGVSHGLALQPPVAAAPPAAGGAPAGPPAYPYYPYRSYRPWRFGFFGPLLFVVFWIFVFRAVLWGVFGGRRRWHRDPDYWSNRFDDWHRRAHERMGRDGASPPSAS